MPPRKPEHSYHVGLGIDPDLHHTGVGVASRDEVFECSVIRAPSALRGEDAVLIMCGLVGQAIEDFFMRAHLRGRPITHVAVEGQTIYPGKTKNPMDILRVGQVAGACLSAALTISPLYRELIEFAEIPEPRAWKGQVPKAVHQARTLDYYNRRGEWSWEVPKDKKDGLTVTRNPLVEMPKSHWKHALDGLALARWAVWEGEP